jgi:hypothetical protein
LNSKHHKIYENIPSEKTKKQKLLSTLLSPLPPLLAHKQRRVCVSVYAIWYPSFHATHVPRFTL